MNNELKQLQEDIKAMQARIDQLVEEDKKVVTGRYKPNVGEPYFTFGVHRGAQEVCYDGGSDDQLLWSPGYIYRTEEETRKALAKQQAYIRMINKIAELNASVGWVCDWGNKEQVKLRMYFSHHDAKVESYAYSNAQNLPREFYYSPYIFKTVIKECSEDFKIWLGVE